MDLNKNNALELMQLHAKILSVLKEKGVLRTTNNPLGDYAEWLFCKAFDWDIEANSAKGFDAVSDGVQYQIKARRITQSNGSRLMSSIRDIADRPFDVLAGVLFNDDYSVKRAALIPIEVVANNVSISTHTNSSRFHLRDAIWELDGVEDVTDTLKTAQ